MFLWYDKFKTEASYADREYTLPYIVVPYF